MVDWVGQTSLNLMVSQCILDFTADCFVKFCRQLWEVYIQTISEQKIEGTMEVNINILLTTIFSLNKNQDRLDFWRRHFFRSPFKIWSPLIQVLTWAHLWEQIKLPTAWSRTLKVSLIEKINGRQIRETTQFLDGASFFCPKPRSTMMIFKCGPKNKLTNVYEFLPCVYKFFVDVECPEVSFWPLAFKLNSSSF